MRYFPKSKSNLKYQNYKIQTEEGRFDSRKEYLRWLYLKERQKDGFIKNLERQTSFELIPSQRIDGKVVERACHYIADFTYHDLDGNYVVEDTKSPVTRTKDYIIKRKLMLHVYGIRITEV